MNEQIEVEKKKLLITTDTYYPHRDGVMIFLEKIVPALAEDYDVTIAVPVFDRAKIKPIGKTRVVGFPVSDKLQMAGYKSVKLSRKNRKRLKQLVKESDVVFSQDLAFLGALSIYYAKKYKKPVFNYVHQITWEHAVDVLTIPKTLKKILAALVRGMVRYLYNKCTGLLVPYKELAEELEERGVESKKIIVHLGVDTGKFSPPEDKFIAKRDIGVDAKHKVVGYVGRISKEKDLVTLKKAYLRLREEYPELRLLIVGSGPDEEMNKLKKIPDVKITGFVKDVVPYLQAMDIFVMPSLTETTSLATLEAMSCGVAVVATRVGYIKEYIINKFNGMFFGKHNHYLLRKRLELLINDSHERHIMGVRARKTVRQKFAWEKTIADVKKALGSA
ncbi:glycosyltransferase family 4 protein [Candidatus Woesearchaeota archaeon]|nr:glycosyltransferase family 4 protein [Candidatus Woesearchaeota archaeon]